MAKRTKNWDNLSKEYWKGAPVPPQLRALTLAQWAHESDWGNSQLAIDNFNFSNIEFNEKTVGLVARRAYAEGKEFARCDSLRSWITCYWHFIDRDNRFIGWRDYMIKPERFVKHVAPMFSDNPDEYVKSVMSIYKNDLNHFEKTGQHSSKS